MFADRQEAGRLLAARLARFRGADAVVLALPRGGVPVAVEIADALGLPLGLTFVRKVGVPGHEELAVAAIGGPEGEDLVVNEDVARMAGLDHDRIDALAVPERAELARRRAAYGAPMLPLAGRTAILVDDGIATGATIRAAAASLRRQRPARLVLAVPVASPDVIAALRGTFDEIDCLETPPCFQAVGAHYRAFPQVSDHEVQDALRRRTRP